MEALKIEPTRMRISDGKFDSEYRYIYKTTGAGQLYIPLGKTIDLPGRGVVYNIADITHTSGTGSTFTSDYIKATL